MNGSDVVAELQKQRKWKLKMIDSRTIPADFSKNFAIRNPFVILPTTRIGEEVLLEWLDRVLEVGKASNIEFNQK